MVVCVGVRVWSWDDAVDGDGARQRREANGRFEIRKVERGKRRKG